MANNDGFKKFGKETGNLIGSTVDATLNAPGIVFDSLKGLGDSTKGVGGFITGTGNAIAGAAGSIVGGTAGIINKNKTTQAITGILAIPLVISGVVGLWKSVTGLFGGGATSQEALAAKHINQMKTEAEKLKMEIDHLENSYALQSHEPQGYRSDHAARVLESRGASTQSRVP